MSAAEPLPASRAGTPVQAARAILELARWAPSVHNTQPWSWHLRGHDLQLRADRTRQLTHSDPEGRNLVMSCGFALHYAVTAAEALGWSTATELLPDHSDPDLLARVSLAPGTPLWDSVAVLHGLERRCTDRRRFTNWPVPPATLRQLANAVREPRVDIVPVTDRLQRWRVELQVDAAMRAQERDAALATEQDRWLDAGPGVGIPRDVLTDSRDSGDSNLRAWPHRFEHTDPVLPARRQVESSDGLLAAASQGDDPEAWLRTGMAVSGLWLRAHAGGLSVVPLSQVVEVPESRESLAQELFGGSLSPQLLLRIGWQEIGRSDLPRTPRRSVDEILSS